MKDKNQKKYQKPSNKEVIFELKKLREFVMEVYEESSSLLRDEKVINGDNSELDVLRNKVSELQFLVLHDQLTGVYNRRGFYEKSTSLFKGALFTKQYPDIIRRKVVIPDFSVIFVDCDNFKKINDSYGHEEGDRILKLVAQAIKESIRDIDVVARFGGEEFVISLVGASEGVAYEKSLEIRQVLREGVHINGDSSMPVTVSIGVASLQGSDADDLDELVAYADQAMYEAKTNRGKDTVVKFSEVEKGK